MTRRPTLADIGPLTATQRCPIPAQTLPFSDSSLGCDEDNTLLVDFSMSDSSSAIMVANPPTSQAQVESPSLQITKTDKIESVLLTIDPLVRAYIEDELRGRFVAVQKLA